MPVAVISGMTAAGVISVAWLTIPSAVVVATVVGVAIVVIPSIVIVAASFALSAVVVAVPVVVVWAIPIVWQRFIVADTDTDAHAAGVVGFIRHDAGGQGQRACGKKWKEKSLMGFHGFFSWR